MKFPRYQYGVECSQCRNVIYSNSRHDFVRCECGMTFVDGGFDYIRVGGEATLDPKTGYSRRKRRRLTEPPPRYFRDETA